MASIRVRFLYNGTLVYPIREGSGHPMRKLIWELFPKILALGITRSQVIFDPKSKSLIFRCGCGLSIETFVKLFGRTLCSSCSAGTLMLRSA